MPEPTTTNPAATAAAALVAARALFAEQGFDATTIDQIASAAGVDPHHLGGLDKEALFRTVFVDMEHDLNQYVLDAAMAALDAGADARTSFFAGCRASLEFSSRADYQQIAVADAHAVLGLREWDTIDEAIGLSSMKAGLEMLAAEGDLAIDPSPGLAVVLFGALTEAGLAVARGWLTIDEALDSFRDLVDRLSDRR